MGDTKQSDFFKRFQGKISKMDKSGHIGVVMKASAPINKDTDKRRNVLKQLISNGMKSKSLGRKEFEINVVKNARDILKRTQNIEYESKTPNLCKKNPSKVREIMKSKESIGPYIKMKQKGKQNLLNSVKFTGERENIYQDSGEKDNMNKIKVPKKYDKFSIHQIRKEFEQNNAYTENQSKHVARNIIRSAAKTNSNSDYNSDYLLDDHSVFKITFDKDSTTVTDMGNSGFSFTEVRSSFDRRMGRSMSFDAKSKQDSLQHILPVINQYRRMMKSPGSISEHHTRAGIPIIL